jgi:dihydroorotate dehydrogenase (fumarate)
MKQLSTSIAGINLASCIGNASGPRDASLEELRIIGESQSASIMMKSCTMEPRLGNPEPRYASIPLGSINSMGLPNLSYKQYLKFIPLLKQYLKPIIASIAGFSLDEYVTMVRAFQDSDVDLIEISLSCPNVVGKSQIGYDFKQTQKTLGAITSLGDKPLGLKLPPYFDLAHFDMMASIIKQFPISFITCINSPGNTLAINPDTQRPLIKPKNGLGGLGGSIIKPIALANVYNFSQRLEGKVDIIGVGGIATGTDIFEFLLAGARAVQIGTTFQEEGADCFTRLEGELSDTLDRLGFDSVQDAIGKLKPFEDA